jgi:acyl-CoA synthetase (NDP forming)
VGNPLDLYPIIEKSGDEVFFEVLKLFAKDPGVDAIIAGVFIPSLLRMGPDLEWLKRYEKPVLFTLKEDLEQLREVKRKIEEIGFPVYPIPERAVRALKSMVYYSQKLSKP